MSVYLCVSVRVSKCARARSLHMCRCLCKVALLRHVVSIAAARADTANHAHFLLALHWRRLALTLFPPLFIPLFIYLFLLLLESEQNRLPDLSFHVSIRSDMKETSKRERMPCLHRNGSMLNWKFINSLPLVLSLSLSPDSSARHHCHPSPGPQQKKEIARVIFRVIGWVPFLKTATVGLRAKSSELHRHLLKKADWQADGILFFMLNISILVLMCWISWMVLSQSWKFHYTTEVYCCHTVKKRPQYRAIFLVWRVTKIFFYDLTRSFWHWYMSISSCLQLTLRYSLIKSRYLWRLSLRFNLLSWNKVIIFE